MDSSDSDTEAPNKGVGQNQNMKNEITNNM